MLVSNHSPFILNRMGEQIIYFVINSLYLIILKEATMFHKTGKQLKTAGKELLSIFKAVSDDIRQEAKVQKQLRTYRKELIAKLNSASAEANAPAHEDAKN